MNLSTDHRSDQPATVYAGPISEELATSLTQAASARDYGLQRFPSIAALAQSTSAATVGCTVLSAQQAVDVSLVVDELRQGRHHLPLIVLLKAGSNNDIVELMQQGIFCVLTEPLDQETLTSNIVSAIRQSQRNGEAYESYRTAAARISEATDKEIEVLDLVLLGKKNKEIAEELGITVRAVEDRRFRLMRKVQVDSLAELVALAVTARLNTRPTTLLKTHPGTRSDSVSCLKGIEVWSPTSDSSQLQLIQSAYTDSTDFEDATEGVTFRRREGLPGEVWDKRAPVFLKELINSNFVRRNAADAAGMTTAIGFPVFQSQKMSAVVVLLLDAEREVTAAFESWRIDPQTERLTLNSGTYINCEKLRRLSEFISLPIGAGLAGFAAEQVRPYATARFQEDTNVIREAALTAEQYTSAVAIPLTDSGSLANDVFVTLNSQSTPVFSIVQVWKNNGNGFRMTTEIVDGVPTLASQLNQVHATPGTLQAKCLSENRAIIGTNDPQSTIAHSPAVARPSFAVAIPTCVRGNPVAITVLGTH